MLGHKGSIPVRWAGGFGVVGCPLARQTVEPGIPVLAAQADTPNLHLPAVLLGQRIIGRKQPICGSPNPRS